MEKNLSAIIAHEITVVWRENGVPQLGRKIGVDFGCPIKEKLESLSETGKQITAEKIARRDVNGIIH
jgi:hypothetical protein